jgi:hypothetical protein
VSECGSKGHTLRHGLEADPSQINERLSIADFSFSPLVALVDRLSFNFFLVLMRI